MSAFQVTATHLAALISFHQRHTLPQHSQWKRPSHVFRVLAQENVRSLQARYEGDTTEPVSMGSLFLGPCDESGCREGRGPLTDAEAAAHIPALSAVQAAKACDSYDYQSCETREYFSSEAAGYIREIRDVIIRVLAHHAYPETINPRDPEGLIDVNTFGRKIHAWHL